MRYAALKSERRERLLDQLNDVGYQWSDFCELTCAQMWEEIDPLGDDESGEAGYGPDSYSARAM